MDVKSVNSDVNTDMVSHECPDSKCFFYIEAMWNVPGEWGKCVEGEQKREVKCSTGVLEDCSTELRPSEIKECVSGT